MKTKTKRDLHHPTLPAGRRSFTRTIKRKTVIVASKDASWFQAESDELLKVALHRDGRRDHVYRLAVWGPDDAGVEYNGDLDNCLRLYDTVRNGVALATLWALGFEQA